jgi:Tfp pilus assembly protein PilN
MTKINLAPDVRQDKLRTKRRNFFVTMGAIIVVGVTLLFILGLQGYKWSRVYSLNQTNKKIKSTQDELKSYKDIEEMVINIEQGIKAVDEIERSEPKWSKFLPVLEQVTPNDVRFTELSVDGNKFTAKAEGRQVYSIARVIKSLENYEYKTSPDDKKGRKLFKNIEVDGYTKGDGGLVNFDITFEMEQGILW